MNIPQAERKPVFWNGDLVGQVQNLRGEQFELYGEWVPEDTPAKNAFIAAARSHSSDGRGLDDLFWIGLNENVPNITLSMLPDKQIIMILHDNAPESW